MVMTEFEAKHRLRALAAALVAAAFVGACSKGGGGQGDSGPQGSGLDLSAVPPSAYALPTASDAARFQNQISFGANDAEIAKTQQYGYSAILEDQFHMSGRSHQAYIEAVTASLPVGSSLGDQHIMQTWWMESASGQDQL